MNKNIRKKLRIELEGYEMSFIELDNKMEQFGFNSEINYEEIILEAENGVWTLNEDDNFQMQVFFRVTSEDNIFILGVC